MLDLIMPHSSYFSISVIALFFACLVLWLISLYFLSSKGNHSWGRVMMLGLIIGITTNVIIFWNPLFYGAANKFLKTSDIGYRQYDALKLELDRFKKHDPDRYLAVGNSQTWALYDQYAHEISSDFSTLMMAGMGTLDFILYKDIIKSRCSSTIILTLSDFDLAREPNIMSAKLSPPQGFGLFNIIFLLYDHLNVSNTELIDFMLANTLDPYRLQYVFKGLLDKLFFRNKAFPEKDETAFTDQEFLEVHLQKLLKLDEKWFDINLFLLDHFITWADKNNLKIVIVEGHYHPKALKANIALHKKASLELELLCKRHENSQFIKSKSLYEFTEADYRDGYHVRNEIGYKFSLILMDVISRNNF